MSLIVCTAVPRCTPSVTGRRAIRADGAAPDLLALVRGVLASGADAKVRALETSTTPRHPLASAATPMFTSYAVDGRFSRSGWKTSEMNDPPVSNARAPNALPHGLFIASRESMKSWNPSCVCVVAGIVVAGCAGPLPTVRARAASDLKCSESGLVVHAPPQANSMSDNSYPFMVEGCGEIGRYVVSYCHGLVGCTVTDAQVVSTSVRKQAGFDLQCAEPAITVQLLGRDTLGARGCGRQTSYSLVQCDSADLDVSGACRVVQNSTRTGQLVSQPDGEDQSR